MSVNPEMLFVYGTLRRGFAGHSLLQGLGARYVGKGRICGELFDLGDFPGAVEPHNPTQWPGAYAGGGSKSTVHGSAGAIKSEHVCEDGVRVVGEVFRIPNPERAFRILDAYERTPGARRLYSRRPTEVKLERGDRVTAWVYWLNRAPKGMRRIISGDYANKARPAYTV